MRSFLRRLIDLLLVRPLVSDPREMLVVEILYRALPILPLAVLANVAAGILIPADLTRYIELLLLILVLNAGVVILVRSGRTFAAARVLIGASWIIVTALCITSGGLHAPAFLAYPAIILGCGILLGMRSGVIVSILTLGAGFVMAWLDVHGLLPPSQVVFTPYSMLVNLASIITIILLTHYAYDYSLEKAFTSAREELRSRRTAEEHATRSRAILTTIFNSTQDLIVSVDRQGKIIAVNAPFIASTRRIHGFEPSVGMALEYVIPPYRLEAVRSIRDSVLRGEQVTVESTGMPADGMETFFEERYTPIATADGSVQGFTINIRDITERKRSEEALRRSKADLERHNESLRTINEISASVHQALDIGMIARVAVEVLTKYSQSPRLAFLVVDKEHGIFRRVGQYGFTEETLVLGEIMPIEGTLSGVSVERREVITTDDVMYDPRIYPPVARALASANVKAGVSIPILYQDEVFGVVNLMFDEHVTLDDDQRKTLLAIGKTIGLAMANARYVSQIHAEIGERQRTQFALQESEERYRRLVENANMLVAEVDEEGRYVYLNRRHTDLLGYRPEDLVGTTILEHIHPDDRHVIIDQMGKEYGVATCRFRHLNGSYRWMEAFSQRLEKLAGRGQYVLVASDVTDRITAEDARKVLEQQLLQSQKLEAIGTLAGGIAHDFNNILVSILGNAELARLKLEPDHPIQKYLARLLEGSERARDLVQQILAFSRRQETERRPVQVQPIVKEALKFMRASIPSTIEIRPSFLSEAPFVLADPTQIHQIVVNLCTNATHAMERTGGILEVSDHVAGVEEILQRQNPALHARRYYVLSVRDTGQGIEPQILPRIFEPFFTTKEPGKGTGLGLSVVHGIVKSHGGAILVESDPGRGTVFEVFFPVYEEAVSRNEPGPAEQFIGRQERVLLVDDEEGIIETSVEILGELGYRVVSYRDPSEALAAFTRDPSQFDVVITDLTMPRMTGIELSRGIRAVSAHVPIILATGYQQLDDPEVIRRAGITEVVSKPFRVNTLARMLRSLLEKRP